MVSSAFLLKLEKVTKCRKKRNDRMFPSAFCLKLLHAYWYTYVHMCKHTHAHTHARAPWGLARLWGSIHIHTYLHKRFSFELENSVLEINHVTNVTTVLSQTTVSCMVSRYIHRLCVSIHVHTYLYTYAHTYSCTHTHTYTRIYVHMYIHTHAHTLTHTHF